MTAQQLADEADSALSNFVGADGYDHDEASFDGGGDYAEFQGRVVQQHLFAKDIIDRIAAQNMQHGEMNTIEFTVENSAATAKQMIILPKKLYTLAAPTTLPRPRLRCHTQPQPKKQKDLCTLPTEI